jgi:hypothetical protein
MLVGGPLVVLRVLHIWTIAYVSSMSISYNDFLLYFFFFWFVYFLCIYGRVTLLMILVNYLSFFLRN